MAETIRPLHSYRVTLWPQHIQAADTEEHARKGALPTRRLKSTDADTAAADAQRVFGQRVLDVERVEEEAGVSA